MKMESRKRANRSTELTRMKSGMDCCGLGRSTVVSGSNLRWPLWPENPTRKESSSDTLIGSITL
ncbi:hypothetical protein A2U01_0059972, partial [Trifolium medium]|nr:hypothetical protein [Trifolium medium]